ncbi:DoxX-like protein [Neolewinella xylanilytica]|uniref:DoxX-like protein n=1 Tax=Neolewinella xylanilytica TaxID=1514080 RepID=A0A2S6I1M8_9BACT|nr:DoxX family protein [Neolewinella xylanilytica]PPK85053.1 DoxX-like protein [Neolewinella xylanilytica]
MKNQRIIFWVTTTLIFLFEGVLPALTFNSELAREGIRHLGYPEYFGNALVVFKVLGALALMIPLISPRVKEWAYAGFAFDFIFASISHAAVDGLHFQTFFPLIVLGVLLLSYRAFHRLTGADSKRLVEVTAPGSLLD